MEIVGETTLQLLLQLSALTDIMNHQKIHKTLFLYIVGFYPKIYL